MKLEKKTINKWKKDTEYCLPELLSSIKKQKSTTFLIGACIVDIYQMQGWLKNFSRKTGDVDFTIEFLGDSSDYQTVCTQLTNLGYTKDNIHPYRYHPPKISGTYAYVDLLTFTTNPSLEKQAKAICQFYF